MDDISLLNKNDPKVETPPANYSEIIIKGYKIIPETDYEPHASNDNAFKHAKGNTSTCDKLDSQTANTNGENVFLF